MFFFSVSLTWKHDDRVSRCSEEACRNKIIVSGLDQNDEAEIEMIHVLSHFSQLQLHVTQS